MTRTAISLGRPDVTRIYLVRHGSTTHSKLRRFSGRNDLPLDAAGNDTAAALSEFMAAFPIDHVLSSPLTRAQQTAQYIAQSQGLPVELHDGLMEQDFGKWEGLTFDEAGAEWPDEMAQWISDVDNAQIPGGERASATYERSVATLIETGEKYRGQHIALVSHVVPIKSMLCKSLRAPSLQTMFRFHLDTASVSVIDYAEPDSCLMRLLNYAPRRDW